ncbi:hypothetical protein PNH38_15285 [Anoxybacillus rupiensis]|uniref:Uncharacterized protein n=1 Tax=Anoxybacteroides rupiense TaxID=311460 RepID=A0ABT5W7B3_9BACL|nr:hypothetical protein [Anoxybacillus rupiensis]
MKKYRMIGQHSASFLEQECDVVREGHAKSLQLASKRLADYDRKAKN